MSSPECMSSLFRISSSSRFSIVASNIATSQLIGCRLCRRCCSGCRRESKRSTQRCIAPPLSLNLPFLSPTIPPSLSRHLLSLAQSLSFLVFYPPSFSHPHSLLLSLFPFLSRSKLRPHLGFFFYYYTPLLSSLILLSLSLSRLFFGFYSFQFL